MSTARTTNFLDQLGAGRHRPDEVRSSDVSAADGASGVPQATVLQRRGAEGLPDITWFALDGLEMTAEDWESSFAKSIAVYLNGQGIPDLDVRGQPATDFGAAWVPVIYTADIATAEEAKPVTAGAKVAVDARAVMVLQARD